MKQQVSPALIAAGVGAVVIIVGIVGFFVLSSRQVTTTAAIPAGHPSPSAAAQIVGPGSSPVATSPGGLPPAAGQVVGPGSQH